MPSMEHFFPHCCGAGHRALIWDVMGIAALHPEPGDTCRKERSDVKYGEQRLDRVVWCLEVLNVSSIYTL